MRIIVLGSPTSWYLADLRRAACDDESIECREFGELRAVVGADRDMVAAGGLDLATIDAVLVRSMPPGSLEQVVVRMDLLGRLATAGVSVINPPRALEVAIDKYLATSRLREAGLAVPRTVVCESVEAAMAAFEDLGGDVVLKPLFGSEGRGIARLQDPAIAERTFRVLSQLRSVLYLQEFVPHQGHDLRVFVCGERMLAMRRRNPEDWRTNVSRGATAEKLALTDEVAGLARRAAAAVGAAVAGVDLLPARDGRLFALEVNAVPGWKALAAVHQVDVARMVLDYLHQSTRGC